MGNVFQHWWQWMYEKPCSGLSTHEMKCDVGTSTPEIEVGWGYDQENYT